jgi:hypothetical protein
MLDRLNRTDLRVSFDFIRPLLPNKANLKAR